MGGKLRPGSGVPPIQKVLRTQDLLGYAVENETLIPSAEQQLIPVDNSETPVEIDAFGRLVDPALRK